MKHITLILTFLLTTFLCFGQEKFDLLQILNRPPCSEHLEPAEDFNLYEGYLKEYYKSRFTLLYSGFSEKPYARYSAMPSFSAEYAFSVEKINGKNYIVSNKFSKKFGCTIEDNEDGNMVNNSVKITTTTTKINNDLYLIIGELFELLANQTKVCKNSRFGLDGETYYFATTDKNGEIKIGTTWSPDKKSLLERLVKICDKLYLVGVGKIINQRKITKEITILINDFQKNN